MNSAIEAIKAEHRNLARVLKSLETILERIENDPHPGDVDRIFDICYYVRVFPDRVHHPKEDRYVFGPLRDAAPEHAELIDRVQAQHARCEALTEQFFEAVKRYGRGDTSVDELRAAASTYVAFQFDHMRIEEDEILPLVESTLDGSVRSRAAGVFSNHGDPLFGENVETGFVALRDRILAGA